MWTALVAFIPLLLLIFQEFLSAKARARDADQKFELNQETYRAIVNAALNKQLDGMAKASQGAGSAWDSGDDNKKKEVLK